LISAGAPPKPRWGSLQRSPDPLAGFKGPTSKGREDRGGERSGRGREGRGREERGGEGEERGWEWTLDLPASSF